MVIRSRNDPSFAWALRPIACFIVLFVATSQTQNATGWFDVALVAAIAAMVGVYTAWGLLGVQIIHVADGLIDRERRLGSIRVGRPEHIITRGLTIALEDHTGRQGRDLGYATSQLVCLYDSARSKRVLLTHLRLRDAVRLLAGPLSRFSAGGEADR